MRSIKRLMFSLSSNFPVLISLAILFIKVLEYSPKVFPFSKKKASLYKLKILESFMNLGQKKAQKIGMLTFQNDKIRLRNCKGDTNYGMD